MMNFYILLCFVGLHLFVLCPSLLIYCRSKKKRPLRKTGVSCESILAENKGAESNVKGSQQKNEKNASKLNLLKLNAKKNESNPKKEDADDKKADHKKKTCGTTAETEQSKEKRSMDKGKNVNSKPNPTKAVENKTGVKAKSPIGEKKKKKDTTKEKSIESTQATNSVAATQFTTLNQLGGRSEKTQSLTKQEQHNQESG